ncbi:MAG: ribosomal protein S18-alanine N-acetyltransferase [Chitinispirillales bacterium]|jgi:ribosomal-protein-alanine N-acetyltransferase|nr:ribosomal protein S18-alanine N-acetyltransferase [Chitinispirillales bacterium]
MTTFRPAGPADIDDVYAIEQACSLNPWTRDGLAAETANPNALFLLAQTPENQIVGFACAVIVLDELHILETAVKPGFRGNGVGTKLMLRLLSDAAGKNAGRAYLEVRGSNRSAIRVYEKCGFGRDGVRKGYYQDGEDAVLMGRALRAAPLF